MYAFRFPILLCFLLTSLLSSSPLLAKVQETSAAQESPNVAAAKANLSKFQTFLKEGKWSHMMPLLSDQGKDSFIIEVCYVLAVSNEIASSGNEGLPPGMETLVERITAVNDRYELDEIAKLIFEGNIEEASKKLEATENKWGIVNALWKAQTGSPFHVHPAFGKVLAAEANGDTVYFDIEMQAVSASKVDEQEFDLAGPAQVIRMTKVKDEWQYNGVDQQRSAERMEKFMAQSKQNRQPQSNLIQGPAFSGTTYDGKEISLSDFKGKIVILDFWAPWCAPCIAAMPEMKLIRETFADHGIEIIGIAADSRENVAAFCEVNQIPWPNIVDADESLVKQFGVGALPTLMMIDKNGKHLHADIEKADLVAELVQHLGLKAESYAELQSLFEKK